MNTDPIRRHRGPFRLQVGRPYTGRSTRKPDMTYETLAGTVTRDDVVEEATAFLTDPRDSVTVVHVFSDREQQHVTTYHREHDDHE